MIGLAYLVLMIVVPIVWVVAIERRDARRREAARRARIRRRAAEIHGRTTLVVEIVGVDHASPAFRAAAESAARVAAKIGGR